METITAVVDNNKIRLEFNDLSSLDAINAFNASFKRGGIEKIWHIHTPDFIEITMSTGDKYPLTCEECPVKGAFPLKSITLNGIVINPSNNEELHEILDSLILQ